MSAEKIRLQSRQEKFYKIGAISIDTSRMVVEGRSDREILEAIKKACLLKIEEIEELLRKEDEKNVAKM